MKTADADGSSTATSASASKSAAGCVLLVDDEPLFLRALARILRSSEHRLLLAEHLEAFGITWRSASRREAPVCTAATASRKSVSLSEEPVRWP